MGEHNVPPYVELREDEFRTLCEQAIGRRYLDVQFHAGKMLLHNTPLNYWAFPILANTRGLNT